MTLAISDKERRDCDPSDFRDFLNHEFRTPLTAAGSALQTLAWQLEAAGGPSQDLVAIALRNIRRLEQTVAWATDYVVEDQNGPTVPSADAACLTTLLEDLDEIDAGMPMTWSTAAGDWQATVPVARAAWGRLLRQVLRAVFHLDPSSAVHVHVATVDRPDHDGTAGLLLTFDVTSSVEEAPVDPANTADLLRRLLTFTVHPDLVQRLELRYDVTGRPGALRARLLIPVNLPVAPDLTVAV